MTKIELFKRIISKKKVDDIQEDDNKNEATIYGTEAEPIIRKLFELDFPHLKVYSPKLYEMYRRIDKPYLTATLDGRLYNTLTKEWGILEIKTHDIRNRADDEAWKVSLPDNYYIQCLHYLMVMNDYNFAILCAKLKFYDYFAEGGKKLLRQEIRYYYIDRKEKLKEIEYLEKEETDFMENHVQNGIIPPMKIEF